MMDPSTNILTVYDADQALKKLYPGRFNRKWKLPFTLDKVDLYKLYKEEYKGTPPYTKSNVEKNYKGWVRYNYMLAARMADTTDSDNFIALVRSPMFWKFMYIQDLIDQSTRLTINEAKFKELKSEDKDKIQRRGTVIAKQLWGIEEKSIISMPRWVILKSFFSDRFRERVRKKEEKWGNKELDSKNLLSIEPLLLTCWGDKYDVNLNMLRYYYTTLKTGQLIYLY